ncbi:MAG: endo-1,4-beta-xylanase [Pirellulaceae bacterium]|nr:endo-1,4-beta-xylanase [Pirellulaceae bacterium]
MRLVIPRPELLVAQAAEQAYLAGAEGVPWECRVTIAGNSLAIERDTRESGYLHFPWLVPERGLVMLSSGALMERQRPYQLPVELARGTLNRLRNQSALWQTAGMVLPEAFQKLLHQATAAFALAATGQEDPLVAARHSDEAITVGLAAADVLSRDYSQQVVAIRRAQHASLGTLVAGRLHAPLAGEAAAHYLAAFNTAAIAPQWSEVEPQAGKYEWAALDAQVQWCRDNNLRIICGPLLQFDRHALPDWLFMDDDYDEVQTAALTYLDAVVQRYRGKVQLWNVTARMNQDGAFKYSEEQRLRLVVEAVDRVRNSDQRTPVIVSFDQPWGEYIARQDQELTPLNFADTLVRGELGLAGVGLEINYGYWPGGTLPRDPLEVSRLIDRWAQLGVPLVVSLAIPAAAAPDSRAQHPGRPLADLAARGLSPQWQQETADWLVPLLVAKQSVQALVWNHWQDDQPHEFAHAGLYDEAGQPRPSLPLLARIRKEIVG